MKPQQVHLFGMDLDNLTMGEAVERIVEEFACIRSRAMVVTPNVDVAVQLERDPQLRADYAEASMMFADGAPLIVASRLFGSPLKERVAGSDLFPLLCGRARDKGLRVMLLGGGDGVAQAAASNLSAKYPGLQILAYTPSIGFDAKPEECARIVDCINEYRPHLLFLGVGTPRQERWIAKYQESYCPCVSMGIGGSFDFEAGRIKRAPRLMRKTGLEWLYRLLKEPRRLFRRYLVDDMRFFALVLREAKARRGAIGEGSGNAGIAD